MKNNEKTIMMYGSTPKDVYKMIGGNMDVEKIYTILDFDGTLNEFHPELIKAFGNDKSAVVAIGMTGKTAKERLESTKMKGDCVCNYLDILVAQGGSVVVHRHAHGKTYYVLPIQDAYNKIKAIAHAMKMPLSEMFNQAMFCIHWFDENECREIVGIPVPQNDEEWVKNILSNHDGNIVKAFKAGALEGYGPAIAIAEYLERGMPADLIQVLYESDLPKVEKTITEMTVVAANLASHKEALELAGIIFNIQFWIGDRAPESRGAKANVRPDIADIVSFPKASHLDAIKEICGDATIFVGLGDQGNDDFLFKKDIAGNPLVDYALVVNAAFIGKDGGWQFAIDMAKLAEEKGLKVAHIRHGVDPNGVDTFGNHALIKLLACESVEEGREVLEDFVNNDINKELRKMLLEM